MADMEDMVSDIIDFFERYNPAIVADINSICDYAETEDGSKEIIEVFGELARRFLDPWLEKRGFGDKVKKNRATRRAEKKKTTNQKSMKS